MVRSLLVALVACFAGCIEPELVPCGELACPADMACTPGGCALPADVATCRGVPEGASCDAANGLTGRCLDGACRTGSCGNGALDPGEICDDGNAQSGDGCRMDCMKLEMCGDGQLDDGEACDDGNDNAADGCDACAATAWTTKVVVGGPIVASQTELTMPHDVAIDTGGRLYITDTNGHRVFRIDPDGTMQLVAGTGDAGFTGDGGPATSARLNTPRGVAVDGFGRLYISDAQNQRIRRVELDGTISTIAGTGGQGSGGGDGGPATAATFNTPGAIAFDAQGRLYIVERYGARIRRVDTNGTISTFAGNGVSGFSGDGGPATSAQIKEAWAVTVGADGTVYISDAGNRRVRKVALDGTITTVAGTGVIGLGADGVLATTSSAFTYGLAVDSTGRLLLADAINSRIRRIEPDGLIYTIAGNGVQGYSGDGGPATAAALKIPNGIVLDGDGQLYIADQFNARLRRVDTAGIITTIAGTGTVGMYDEGLAATSVGLTPWAVTIDAQGRTVIADNAKHRIVRIEADGTLVRVAGVGTPGFTGDGGPARDAALFRPYGLAFDGTQRLVIADRFNHRVRRIDTSGTISTIAGTGTAASSGDGGPATAAAISSPMGVAVDAMGRVFIAELDANRVRRIDVDGTISTIAGTGDTGYNGDAQPAASAWLNAPMNVAVDASGRVVIADTGNSRVRRIESDGTITTIAQVAQPVGLAFDSQGRLYIGSQAPQAYRLELDGSLTTIAGTGSVGFSGDGDVATAALVSAPTGIAVDGQGRVVIGDGTKVRLIETDGVIRTVGGRIEPADVLAGPVARGRLGNPQALAVSPGLTLVAGGSSGTLLAVHDDTVEVAAGWYPQLTATANSARFLDTTFGSVGGVARDPTTGIIYISETTAHQVHAITPVVPMDPTTWTLATVVNDSGVPGTIDGPAATAGLHDPMGLWFDEQTRVLYIADSGNNAIRALTVDSGVVSTVANVDHRIGIGGDGGQPSAALMCRPSALTRCPNRDMFVTDTCNNRVRRISNDVITTVLGDGVAASSGEGSPAATFPVDEPRGVACDAHGNLFVTSSATVRLLLADDAGIIDGTGSVQTIYGALPRSTFPSSNTMCLTGVAVTSATTVDVLDACTGLLLEISRGTSP